MNEQDIEDEFIKDIYASKDIRFAHKRFYDIWPRLRDKYGLITGLRLELS